jgi:protein TonB
MLLTAHRPAPVVDVIPNKVPTPATPSITPGHANPLKGATFHYYGIPAPARISWLAVLVSASLHAGLLLSFNKHVLPKKHVVEADGPSEMMMMPDLKEPEDDKPKELNDEEPAAPSVQVPMLQDVPVNVPVDSTFTQLPDLNIPAKLDGAANSIMSIPMNIQRGRPDTSAMKDLFNIADLDRKPEAIMQTAPVFPFELKQSVPEARVRVGFIVNSSGDVIMPYIVNSTHRGFERAALEAVGKWKFKPGMRGGRKVNTRVEQPIDFKVMDDAN